VGLANPALYAAEKTAFTDITEGNNDGFEAGPGWDPVTGLGSPKGPGVLAALSVWVPSA
jgi:kumamolisin